MGYCVGTSDANTTASCTGESWRTCTTICLLGEGRVGHLMDVDRTHQLFIVVESGGRITGEYRRQRPTPDSTWDGWERVTPEADS